MKEQPLLCIASSVRAILAGQKTQTRRIMKPQPSRVDGGVPFGDAPAWACAEPGSTMIRCKYGKRGDRLWVREAWSTHAEFDDVRAGSLTTRSVHYQVDGRIQTGRSRAAMHMPKWASRIMLEITSVRAERLQDISEADAWAEGVEKGSVQSFERVEGITRPAGFAYRELWESINAKSRPTLPHNTASKRYERVKKWLETHPDTSSWDADPWVWVLEFKRINNG